MVTRRVNQVSGGKWNGVVEREGDKMENVNDEIRPGRKESSLGRLKKSLGHRIKLILVFDSLRN